MEFRDKCLKNDEKLRLIFKVNEILEEAREPEQAPEPAAEVEMAEEEEEEVITLNPNKLYESSDESDTESPQDHRVQNQIQSQLQLPQQALVIPISNTNNNKILPPQAIQMPDKREIFHCRYCDVVFSESASCSNHEMNNHDPINPYECVACPFKTNQHTALIHHIKQIHKLEKPFLCTQCSKTFIRRSDLRKHTFVHAGKFNGQRTPDTRLLSFSVSFRYSPLQL